MKQCTRCREEKELSLFNKSPASKDGHRPECKACKKAIDKAHYDANADKKRQYARKAREGRELELSLRRMGMTMEQYHQKLDEQNGLCAICSRPETLLSTGQNGEVRRLSIDHDHSCCSKRNGLCGQCNRGLLCSECNQGLGRFQDNPDYLAAAIKYLERYKNED